MSGTGGNSICCKIIVCIGIVIIHRTYYFLLKLILDIGCKCCPDVKLVYPLHSSSNNI